MEFIRSIDPSTSVLFLGSGFSIGAQNLLSDSPPTGAGLRDHFRERLNLPKALDHDLRVLAEEFAATPGESIYKELYQLYTISSVSSEQREILSPDWLRVYTTNYDDIAEFALHERRAKVRSFSYSDPVPNRLDRNIVVHLHGSVRNLAEHNVLDQLVLSENSYVRQHFEKSPWYDQFIGDVRFCTNCFFVGYSLSDYHISALLMQNPAVREKTLFIQKAPADPIFDRRVAPYGRVENVGTQGFAEAIRTLPRVSREIASTSLKSFRHLNPVRDKKALKPATAIEVMNLLIFGAFNYVRCTSGSRDPTYVIPRTDLIDEVCSGFEQKRSVVIDSRLGNGKSIILFLAILKLSELGFDCFLFREAAPDFQPELDYLRTIKRPIIVFDNYTIAQDVIRRIAEEIPHAKFLVEVRTGIYEVRFHEVSSKIPSPFIRINVNRLSSGDIDNFRELCRRAGISVTGIDFNRPGVELRELLLQLFDSPNIRAKISETLSPVFNDPAARKVLLLTLLLSRFHLPAEAAFIRAVTGVDAYQHLHFHREAADEVFRIEDDQVQIRSAIFSDFAVRQFISVDEVLDTVHDAALNAAGRKDIRQYRLFMSNLMQFSNLRDLLRDELDPVSQIMGMYERLRHDDRVNVEPLFWLQYAIAAVEAPNLVAAEEFIKTAYDHAANRAGFRTYQIDTQAFRVVLLIETGREPGEPVARMPEIIERAEIINSMIGEESHRAYAIRVLENVEPFVRARRSDFTQNERVALTFWLSKLVDTLEHLSAEYRAMSGSDAIKGSLVAAKSLLL